MSVTTLAVSNPLVGELVLPNARQWYQLPTRPCTKIRLSAPTASGCVAGAVNANSVLGIGLPLGTSPLPIHASGGGGPYQGGTFELPPTATGLSYINLDNSACVWLLALSAGDCVEYSIE